MTTPMIINETKDRGYILVPMGYALYLLSPAQHGKAACMRWGISPTEEAAIEWLKAPLDPGIPAITERTE